MNGLPAEFEKRMREMLGEEYEDYEKSFAEARRYGLRINRLKAGTEEGRACLPFPTEPIPWTENGFSYQWEAAPARLPFYAAGLYYLQEPSAMTPAALFPVEPGDRVLDLCAAPGGKATELGAKLKREGVLVANDISNSRAKALLHNLELFGIPNLFVTNETPDNLAFRFPGFFDKILVDAPCSGEGMFRKDPAAVKAWYPGKPGECAVLQKEILKSAAEMLAPGGLLLYSTCTFAPEENEGTISWLLEEYPELKLTALPHYEGFSEGNPRWGSGEESLALCVRLWPHRMEGEGHFLALLKKEGQKVRVQEKKKRRKLEPEVKRYIEEFLGEGSWRPDWERVELRGERVYQVPDLPENLKGIRFLRNGLFLGEMKKKRFEPSQALALCLKPGETESELCLKNGDLRLEQYLRGESISVKAGETRRDRGWQLVCVENFSLGWGKLVNGVLKNKYMASWRRN